MRKRLSREESRELTTKRLLDAAERLIAKKGLNATSVEDIAAAAGYSRGAFYSNFDSKNQLFIETLRRDHQQAHALFTALYDDTKTFEQVLARLRDMYSQQYRDDKSLMNWSEARILAARDREFRARLSVVDAERHGDINVLVEYVFRRAGITPPAPVSLMAMGFASLFEGVKMTMLSAPTGISPEDAETLLNLFIESFIPHPNEQDAGQSGPSAANPVR